MSRHLGTFPVLHALSDSSAEPLRHSQPVLVFPLPVCPAFSAARLRVPGGQDFRSVGHVRVGFMRGTCRHNSQWPKLPCR